MQDGGSLKDVARRVSMKNIINLRGKSPGKQLRTTNASVESSTSIGESVST